MSVTPDGANEPVHDAGTGGFTNFTVQNTGTTIDSFTVWCSATGGAVCGDVTKCPELTILAGSESKACRVFYSVLTSNGTIFLHADGHHSNDTGLWGSAGEINDPMVPGSDSRTEYRAIYFENRYRADFGCRTSRTYAHYNAPLPACGG